MAIARERSVPLEELVEEAVISYPNGLKSESKVWVKATQGSVSDLWPAEDFTDWMAAEDR